MGQLSSETCQEPSSVRANPDMFAGLGSDYLNNATVLGVAS